MDALYFLAGALVIVGALASVLGALGLVRFPDLYTRLHASSLAGLLGMGPVFVAIALISFDVAIATRAMIGIGFLLITAPLVAHLLARSARKSGLQPAPETSIAEEGDPR